MAKLFDPIKLGSIEAKNRIFMAPMTRARGTRDAIPTPIMSEYYGKRASAGLIITEAVGISLQGHGWPYATGIWNKVQRDSWQTIARAIHNNGGKVFMQLWHVGRANHSEINGLQPVSSSATRVPSQIHTFAGKKDGELAHELTPEEIHQIVRDFAAAAKSAISAGFDGVQLHGANGYLIEQFLKDSTNKRTDEYGGSIKNRIRFLDEVVSAVVNEIGAERTAVRLSPNADTHGTMDSDPESLYVEVAKALDQYGLAFLELREVEPDSITPAQPKLHRILREHFKGPLGLNSGFNRQTAIDAVESGEADFIAFGQPFIGSSDVVERLRTDKEFAAPDYKRLYTQGPEGYLTD